GRLVRLDRLPSRETCEQLPQLGRLPRWGQDGLRSAFDLLRCIPEQALGSPVPARDGPVQPIAENSIVRRFDEGGQVAYGLTDALALGDVPDRRGDQTFPLHLDRVQPDLDGELRTVTPASLPFEPGPHDPLARSSRYAVRSGGIMRRHTIGHQELDRL